MRKFFALILLVLGFYSIAMDKPPRTTGLLEKFKGTFLSTLSPEQATQKLQTLIDGDDKNITLKNIQPLIEAGANKEIKNAQGKTILMRAVEVDNEPAVTFLLKKGAHATSGPLAPRAAFNRNRSMLEKLIAAGADINAKDENGLSALYFGAHDARPEIVRLLLFAGADPNIQAIVGDTPMHVILAEPEYTTGDLINRKREILSLLLQKGADKTIANKKGKTPVMLAKGSQYEAMLKVAPEKKFDETSLKLLEQMQKGKGRK